jgi:hypothetical protein
VIKKYEAIVELKILEKTKYCEKCSPRNNLSTTNPK